MFARPNDPIPMNFQQLRSPAAPQPMPFVPRWAGGLGCLPEKTRRIALMPRAELVAAPRNYLPALRSSRTVKLTDMPGCLLAMTVPTAAQALTQTGKAAAATPTAAPIAKLRRPSRRAWARSAAWASSPTTGSPRPSGPKLYRPRAARPAQKRSRACR